ncbi:uncharacterized protein ACLA_076380 [Aspergillus clavatus NRRL 1]|uniref:Integral membrane protein n=1 Tax=Aspergillus clavatus (strain ATCC 1007 / CBS 513.65 / DSM 816 / NCTC 3887 / NRRL 1 / QM 1276 / 107) TaxID=344612 RepID=A1C877_ASPCL|nr:uncharacterized protein ACLA_076380 [Aspergillus clavatus NRRL 1]EAW14598.1 conserved hypothetical protein [Aspergillus clavatus NRRL 1]
MLPCLFSLNSLIYFTSWILACEAAFVRRYPCESSPGLRRNGDFHLDSLNGKIHQAGETTVLTFTLSSFYNASQYNCDELLLAGSESNGQFRVAGYPVGHLDQVKKHCRPAPAIWRLPESSALSTWELSYSFDSPPRLQTLATEVSFSLHRGPDPELGCVAVRITPDIGPVASGVFTFIPASIIVLVGLASWLSHAEQTRGYPASNLLLKRQSLLARILVDIADYVRYLQFIFLAASLSMQYPGFYQPVASQLAWSSLLYWTGPVEHGFTYPGVEDGFYAINGTYGLEYMAQNLGFPTMSDIMVDALINLCILGLGFVALMLIVWLVRCGSWPSSALSKESVARQIKEAGCGMIAVPLLLFSLPLLAYLSYQLILVGYLPGYRISLVVLMIGVLIGSNIFIARHQGCQSDSEEAPSKATVDVSHYVLYGVPMVQGLAIGGLQLWGWAQLLLLGACEVLVLVHLVVQRPTGIILSRNIWCAAVRLATIILSICFVCPLSESARQWIGYFMLGLHGSVVVFGFLFISLWQIGRIVYLRNSSRPLPPLHPYELSSHSSRSVNADAKGQQRDPLSDVPDRYRLHAAALPESVPHTLDTSSFYRTPRARTSCGALSEIESRRSESNTSSTASSGDSMHTVGDSYTLDELLQRPSRSDVDYSVRESDMYYGRIGTSPSELPRTEDETETSRETFSQWKRRAVERLRRTGNQEKGFVVIRPRPT